MADAAIYRLAAVHRRFRRGDHIVDAVDGVDMEIFDGEFVAIQGPSGSGKSTLLQLLGGLERASTGTLSFDDRELRGLNDMALTKLRAQDFGFIFQQFNLIPTLTAAENVEAALVTQGLSRRQRRERAVELLGRVGLDERTHHLGYNLSGGEQQRVAIARALANKPRVILADEPTGNLDSRTAADVVDLLRALCSEQRVTVILVTHDNAIANVADRVVHMSDGRISDVMRPQEPRGTTTVDAHVERDDRAPDASEGLSDRTTLGGRLQHDMAALRSNLGALLSAALVAPLALVTLMNDIFPAIGQSVGASVGGEAESAIATSVAVGAVGMAVLLAVIQMITLPMLRRSAAVAPTGAALNAGERMIFGAVGGAVAGLAVGCAAPWIHVAGVTVTLNIDWPVLLTLGPLALAASAAFALWLGTARRAPMAGIAIALTALGSTVFGWTALGPVQIAGFPWLQILTLLDPLTYVTEGLRAALTTADHMSLAAVYPVLIGACLVFPWCATRVGRT